MKRNTIDATLPEAAPLNAVEQEVIHLFIQFSRALNLPRSVAEIYGLLFVSHLPLTLDDLQERLKISRGSACQGLQYLRELGAVRAVEIPGRRRTHYEAVAELRNLAGSYLRQRILTHFNDSTSRLESIGRHAEKLSDDQRKFVTARVKTLHSWEANAKRVFPMLMTLLGGRNGAAD